MSVLYEGKAKRVLTTEDPFVLEIEYKDEVTAGNGQKHDFLPGKGRLNNLISSEIFQRLEHKGIPSHYVDRLSDTNQRVKKVSIIPLEVVVRNIAAGSIVKRLGFIQGSEFMPPLVEFYLKDDALNDPIVTEGHIKQLGIASQEDIDELKRRAGEVNAALIDIMGQMNLKLVDFKLEFGHDTAGNILLADEISPDTCRLWDKKTNENFDKDVYRNDTGSLIDTYERFYNKLEEAE
jgi:phosphoribosylaminoimidazole-succinocarboxamide synthase